MGPRNFFHHKIWDSGVQTEPNFIDMGVQYHGFSTTNDQSWTAANTIIAWNSATTFFKYIEHVENGTSMSSG